MSKRGGQKRNNSNYGRLKPNGGMQWQSGQLNSRIYSYYRNIIMQLAMSRFHWINLPSGCDERYLEWQLLTEGVATIAFPARAEGMFLSLKAATQGPMTMYGNPSEWLGIGDNGTRIRCNPMNGVLVWDNASRYPLLNGIDLYANELTHMRMVKRTNRLHQQIPFVFKGPQEKKQEMINLFKQVAGGEPAIIATNGLDMIDIDVIQTGVQYIGEELAQDEANVWNRIYMMLGAASLTFKQERQTEDEIKNQKSPSNIIRMNYLSERRKAARLLNERFGDYLNGEVSVVWNEDWESDNWSLVHNVREQMELEG